MKRLSEIIVNGVKTGTFNYSNGMVGTRDLPAFVSETAYFRKHFSKRTTMHLNNIKAAVDRRMTWREQLAKVASGLKAK